MSRQSEILWYNAFETQGYPSPFHVKAFHSEWTSCQPASPFLVRKSALKLNRRAISENRTQLINSGTKPTRVCSLSLVSRVSLNKQTRSLCIKNNCFGLHSAFFSFFFLTLHVVFFCSLQFLLVSQIDNQPPKWCPYRRRNTERLFTRPEIPNIPRVKQPGPLEIEQRPPRLVINIHELGLY